MKHLQQDHSMAHLWTHVLGELLQLGECPAKFDLRAVEQDTEQGMSGTGVGDQL